MSSFLFVAPGTSSGNSYIGECRIFVGGEEMHAKFMSACLTRLCMRAKRGRWRVTGNFGDN